MEFRREPSRLPFLILYWGELLTYFRLRSFLKLSTLSISVLGASYLVAPAAGAQGFTTSAPHAIIMDAETGLILFEKDAAKPMAPASMTKIMTASLIFDRIREGSITLETKFKVSEEAWRRGGKKSGSSTMFLEIGSEVSVGDLLKGVIIQSGNDACIVLAEGIAGSETAFADLMTTRARELGFESATFRNATGWPVEGHEISAADLAALARYTITEYPEFYSLYGEPNFTWNGITQSNRNPLLGKFTGADGLKTGHTEISKYGLVGSAVRGDDRRIIVVNGLESKKMRSSESLRVMSAAFNDYKVYTLFDDGASVGQAPVFMGEADTIELRASGAAKVGLYRILRKNIKVHLEYDSPIAAPIKAGDKVGELVVSLPGHPKTKFDLVAGADVERQGVFGRAMASLKLKFGN